MWEYVKRCYLTSQERCIIYVRLSSIDGCATVSMLYMYNVPIIVSLDNHVKQIIVQYSCWTKYTSTIVFVKRNVSTTLYVFF